MSSPSKTMGEGSSTKTVSKNNFSISSILAEDSKPSLAEKSPAASHDEQPSAERLNGGIPRDWSPSTKNSQLEDMFKPMLSQQHNFLRTLPWAGNPYLLQSLANGKRDTKIIQ